MVLDGVHADPYLTWLGTERERHYFKDRLGDLLGPRVPEAGVRQETKRNPVRYFPDKLPIGHERDRYRHVFIYIYGGGR